MEFGHLLVDTGFVTDDPGAKLRMQLMDDELFELWREEKCTLEDALSKAQLPDYLARRILIAKGRLTTPST